ncbi:hypothetical protein DIPPA_21309 [Diplonema papillatum]|nr:hypothetical protein DIPPA_21309 [Diplonema papillatum]
MEDCTTYHNTGDGVCMRAHWQPLSNTLVVQNTREDVRRFAELVASREGRLAPQLEDVVTWCLGQASANNQQVRCFAFVARRSLELQKQDPATLLHPRDPAVPALIQAARHDAHCGVPKVREKPPKKSGKPDVRTGSSVMSSTSATFKKLATRDLACYLHRFCQRDLFRVRIEHPFGIGK